MTPDWPGDTAPLPHAVAEDRVGVRLAGMVGDDERCPRSKRVDGPRHSWRFDGDDPYVVCFYCNEVRDALTDRVVRRGIR